MARTPQTPAAETILPVPPVPGWARSGAPVTDTDADSGADSGAAFRAGAALAMLDGRVRAGVPFDGAWRRRLALKAAAASARIARRGEDEAMLRHGGDDPGPAGRMLVAWRGLDRSAPLADDSGAVARRRGAGGPSQMAAAAAADCRGGRCGRHRSGSAMGRMGRDIIRGIIGLIRSWCSPSPASAPSIPLRRRQLPSTGSTPTAWAPRDRPRHTPQAFRATGITACLEGITI
jgi:Protein of unknown function (DUF1403)